MNAINRTELISTDRVPRTALHPLIMLLPSALLVGALVTDLLFAALRVEFWALCSLWLLFDGLAMVVIASIFEIIHFFGQPPAPNLLARARNALVASIRFGGNGIVLVVGAANLYLRWNDVSDAIVPTGLVLSAIAAVLLLGTGRLAGQLPHRQRRYRYQALAGN